MQSKMTESEIRAALSGLHGWAYQDGALVKRFLLPTYLDGLKFVEALAIEAEARDHHPDILLSYADVTVTFSTHSAGGVTEKDADSAKSADRIAVQYGVGR